MLPALVLGFLCTQGHIGWTDGVYADTWFTCNCHWNAWKPWGDCNSDCFGRRLRERSVQITNYPGCEVFTDCASNDEGYQYSSCNNVCSNGGTPLTSYCNCVTGYTGQCCRTVIDCGTPTAIANGAVSNAGTTYGSTATYTCDMHYNLTHGSQVRTCQTNFAWSGTLARCVFVNHCATSVPCQNGASCTDLLDDYSCACLPGWSGKNCDVDIQPPVMSGCPSSVSVNATASTKYFNWTEPTFNDPFGNDIAITKNYQTPNYEFPWGDFTVQYTATKPSNGLSTECIFTIHVRPTPCDELNIPDQGSRICNDWKTDYGKFCLVACNSEFMIGPAHQFGMLYACGASGAWSAGPSVPDCNVPVVDDEFKTLNPEFLVYSYEDTCIETGNTQYLQEIYVERLCGNDGEFKQFCETYPEESLPQNVEVVCL